MYRFLLRPKWLLFLAGCAAFSALFVNLGFWQLDRLDQRRAMNSRVIAARHAQPAPASALFGTDRAPARGDEFRMVQASGRYDTQHEFLVHGRAVNQETGIYVLTPLVTGDGSAVLVVRGWVPFSSRGADVAPDFPAAPSGDVTVIGRVRMPENAGGGTARIGPYTAVRRIDPAVIGRAAGHPTVQGYVELVRQTPPAGRGFVTVPEPEITEGPHLSYAVQWFLFACMTFVGYGIYARREAEARRGDAGAPTSPALVGAERPEA